MNDNSVGEFNIDTMKININDLLNEHNITQTELAKRIGVQQPRISDALSLAKPKHRFTYEQLAKIAVELEVSVDDLMGIDPTKKKKPGVSLKDIMQTLFDLDDITDMKITRLEDLDCLSEDEQSELEVGEVYALYFGDRVLDDYLKQWYEYKSCSLPAPEKREAIKRWKEAKLNETKDYQKKWGFRTEWEQKYHLAGLLLAYFQSLTDFYDTSPDEIKPLIGDNFLDFYVSKEKDIPIDLLDKENRQLLEREIPSIIEEGILPMSQIRMLQPALQWLLNNTESIDFS